MRRTSSGRQTVKPTRYAEELDKGTSLFQRKETEKLLLNFPND